MSTTATPTHPTPAEAARPRLTRRETLYLPDPNGLSVAYHLLQPGEYFVVRGSGSQHGREVWVGMLGCTDRDIFQAGSLEALEAEAARRAALTQPRFFDRVEVGR